MHSELPVVQKTYELLLWMRRIEVHGTDLRIVYSFPWFPEGDEAANEPMSGGGGGVTPLDAAGGRRGRSPRTTQAEPSECRVLPMIVNGSPEQVIDRTWETRCPAAVERRTQRWTMPCLASLRR